MPDVFFLGGYTGRKSRLHRRRPVESTFGYAMYAFEQAWIARAGNNRFFVDHLRTGAWPSVCRGSVTPSWELDGKWVVARYHAEPHEHGAWARDATR